MAITQESLPIAFLLTGGSILPMVVVFDSQLGIIRPENLNYTRPSRRVIYNTALPDTAFLDDWGEGVGQLVISGHTGYSPAGGVTGLGNLAGLGVFKLLEVMITQFWTRRQTLAAAGKNPDAVGLYMLDAMNVEALKCYPDSLTLSRSRTRPQLYMYRLQLTIMSDLLETPPPFVADFLSTLLGQANVTAATANLTAAMTATSIGVSLFAFASLLAEGIAFG